MNCVLHQLKVHGSDWITNICLHFPNIYHYQRFIRSLCSSILSDFSCINSRCLFDTLFFKPFIHFLVSSISIYSLNINLINFCVPITFTSTYQSIVQAQQFKTQLLCSYVNNFRPQIMSKQNACWLFITPQIIITLTQLNNLLLFNINGAILSK